MNCSYCNKECKNNNSFRNHERLCKLNPNRILPKKTQKWYDSMAQKKIKGTASNRALKCKELGIPFIVSTETRKKLSDHMKLVNTTRWTPEARQKHSMSMRNAVLNNPDSYSKNNVVGRVINTTYNGVKLKGSWELLVAQNLDKCNIEWTTDIKPFNYQYENKWRLYFPDFYLPQYDLYIEVKGYERERDRAKWKVINNLIVFKHKDIKSLQQQIPITQIINHLT